MLNPKIIPCIGTSANSPSTANTNLQTAIVAAVAVAVANANVLANQTQIVYNGVIYDGTNYQASGAVIYATSI